MSNITISLVCCQFRYKMDGNNVLYSDGFGEKSKLSLYVGADTEKLERHIFRMYDSNKVGQTKVLVDFMKYFKKGSKLYSKCSTVISKDAR